MQKAEDIDKSKPVVSEDPTKVSNSEEPTTSVPVETVNKSGVSVADCLTDHIVEQLLNYDEQLMARSRRTSVSLADSQEE